MVRVEVETLATEIQSDIQHCRASLRLFEDARSIAPREALLHEIQFFGVIHPCARKGAGVGDHD